MPAAVSPIIAQISSKELPYEGLTVAKYLKDLPSSSCSVLDLDFHIVAASHHDLAILRAYFHAYVSALSLSLVVMLATGGSSQFIQSD